VTVTRASKDTFAGARHTWSLHAWNVTVPRSLRAPFAAPAVTVTACRISASPS
jgi:hypothetical protein